MKIAILTYLHAQNYGAELQCFALQCKLRNMGFDVTVLNIYRPTNKEYLPCKGFEPIFSYKTKADRISKMRKKMIDVYTFLNRIVYAQKFSKSLENFNEFHNKYTSLSNDTFMNFEQLYRKSESFDYTHYIVGSDQVWNFDYPFSIEPFFLTFVKKGVKISYAASIGHSELPDSVRLQYEKWLTEFSHISLREHQGVELIKNILSNKKEVFRVLDPTFLLTKSDWLKNLEIETNINYKYVLVYLLSVSNDALSIARKIASKLDARIIIVASSPVRKYHGKDLTFILGEGPKVFVELFAGASFVVTNSFHGTAFSVNFNVPFIVVTRKNKRVNSRFVSLLSDLNLMERYCYENEVVDIHKFLNLDFSEANVLLDNLRKFSENYLLKSLS